MKAATGWLIGWAVVLVALAGWSGYRLGIRSVTAATDHGSDNTSKTAPKTASKILYYRNPMGLPDTSPTPKKDPMGMDYIPVYAGAEGADDKNTPRDGTAAVGTVVIDPQKVQKLGVRVQTAQRGVLDKTIRAAGRIEADERRWFTVSPRFEGYIDRLHVNVTGQTVVAGQPLFEAFSPELAVAQREYLIAVQGKAVLQDADGGAQADMAQLAQSGWLHLRHLGLTDDQIKALAATGVAQRTLTFRSPVSGVVMDKKAVQGMRFVPGDALYQVADLTRVWVITDIAEQDIAGITTGAPAQVSLNAYPDTRLTGTVTYVYPTLKPETRTVQVRVELPNPGGLLKPGMFAQVVLQTRSSVSGIIVPLSAVIDSGTRQIVLVQRQEGHFEPRTVTLGVRNDHEVAVLTGLQDGERVVVAANFLIDAESNLKAATGGLVGSLASSAPASAASVSAARTPVSQQAQGTVMEIDRQAGTVSIAHGPIASLGWPAMTMDFKVSDVTLWSMLKPHAVVAFDLTEGTPGEWMVTHVQSIQSTRDHQRP